MKNKELQFILQEGEGLKIEFKSSFDKSIAKEIVAFRLGGNVPENVPERRIEKILEYMNKNNEITIIEIASLINVNEKTIKRDIEKLKKKGIVKRIGPAKGGHWKIEK